MIVIERGKKFIFYFSREKIFLKKLITTCSKATYDGRGWGPVTSSFCQKGLEEQPDKIRLSCKAKQLCTVLRRPGTGRATGRQLGPQELKKKRHVC